MWPRTNSWIQDLLLIVLAVVLEALVDLLMDRYRIVRRDDEHSRHNH